MCRRVENVQRDDSDPQVAGASASERVAELFCKNRFGDSAVGRGFERGIAADCATGWMNGNVGQQSLDATEQRVSSAGGQPSVATRVAAAQEGPDEAMRQALAASSAKETSAVSNAKGVLAASRKMTACAARDADVVEKNQMGGEKLMLLIGSNVLHHHDQVAECRGKTRKTYRKTGCDHDDDADCKQSERGQVQELRGAMCETS